MKLRRIIQITKYGWKHAGEIASNSKNGRLKIFLDIIGCYKKYHIWSNQYKKERFWEKFGYEREDIGQQYKKKNDEYEQRAEEKLSNRKFLHKWSSFYWELGLENRRKKRNKAYSERYNMGKNCYISYNVIIETNHFMPGKISIGDNVLLSRNVYIDYSGEVIVGSNVSITAGVSILSHEHPIFTDPSAHKETTIQKKIIIEDGVIIGNEAIIDASVGRIGRNARIGAGSVVRNNIPPYAIVIGNPAKIVGFSMPPEQVEEYEKQNYQEEERISIDKYTNNYQKLFLDRIEEISKYLKK